MKAHPMHNLATAMVSENRPAIVLYVAHFSACHVVHGWYHLENVFSLW
jgi:hypothetical protein